MIVAANTFEINTANSFSVSSEYSGRGRSYLADIVSRATVYAEASQLGKRAGEET